VNRRNRALARTIAGWVGIASLVVVSGLGLQSALEALEAVVTQGQRIAIVTQFGYALVGMVAAVAVVTRRSWARASLWLWAGLVTVTGGMAPMVWGGTGIGPALVAAAATAAIAALVLWLITRRQWSLEVDRG
jgi:hypothetical protein